MAKRGRPPKAEAEKKSAHLNFRMPDRLRRQLEAAAKEAERSLGLEVELRLRRSFELDQELSERFGSPGTFFLFRMMADGIALVQHNASRGGHKNWEPSWLHNRFVFDQVVSMIATTLAYFTPSGKRTAPKQQGAEDIGRHVALYQLQGLQIDSAETLKAARADRATLAGAVLPLKRFVKGKPGRDLERSMWKHAEAWLKEHRPKS